MESTFSKRDTAMVKGVAIMAMVFHHVCQVDPGVPVDTYGVWSAESLLAAAGKVCVSLLTLLSGFGLAEGFARRKEHSLSFAIRFTLSHLLQLLSVYWCFLFLRHAYAWFTEGISLTRFYGAGRTGLLHALADLTGIGFLIGTPTGSEDWYLKAVLIFYAAFPLLYLLLERGRTPGRVLLLLASYAPWIVYLVRGDGALETDTPLFYLFSFVLGIVLSQTGLPAAQKRMGFSLRGLLFSLAFFGAALGLRAYVTMPADPVLAFAILELEIFCLSWIPGLRGALHTLGRHSANIWLIHPTVLVMLGLGFVENWMYWLTVLFLSTGISMVTEAVREGSGFNRLLRRLRGRLTAPSAPRGQEGGRAE